MKIDYTTDNYKPLRTLFEFDHYLSTILKMLQNLENTFFESQVGFGRFECTHTQERGCYVGIISIHALDMTTILTSVLSFFLELT